MTRDHTRLQSCHKQWLLQNNTINSEYTLTNLQTTITVHNDWLFMAWFLYNRPIFMQSLQARWFQVRPVPKSKLYRIVVADILQGRRLSCRPTNSIKAPKDEYGTTKTLTSELMVKVYLNKNTLKWWHLTQHHWADFDNEVHQFVALATRFHSEIFAHGIEAANLLH